MSPIPSRIYNAAVGGHVCGPEDVDFGQKVVHLVKYDRSCNEVSFESQVTQANKIYVIHDDFVLSSNVTIPANCVLEFDGGSILGSQTLTGTNTILDGDIKCFVTISGTFANDYLDVTWFGAVGNDNIDNIGIIKNVFAVCVNSKANMYIPEGVFATKSNHFTIYAPTYPNTDETDLSQYLDCNNITIFGCGDNSVIKGYHIGDVINIYCAKNLTIKNIAVTFGGASGSPNLISINSASNLHIDNVYAHDTKWTYYHNEYFDGGKGITIQAETVNNISITNCRIRNCIRGIDITTTAAFFNNPESYVYCQSNVIEKCYRGVAVVGNLIGNAQSGYNRIVSGLINVQAKTINCLQAFFTQGCLGVNADIQNTSDETIAELFTDGYGNQWIDTSVYTDIDYAFKYAIVGLLYTCSNSNINISSYSKHINVGYQIIGTYGLSDSSTSVSENNVMNLKLNSDVSVENMIDNTDIVKGKFVAGLGNDHYIKNSVFILNGLGVDATNVMDFFTSDNYFGLVVISDGNIFTRRETLQKLTFKEYNGALRGVYTELVFDAGTVCFRNFAASSPSTPAFGVLSPSGEKTFGVDGRGDILAKNIYLNDDDDTVLYGKVMGGGAIPVRLFSNLNNVAGYIQVSPFRTKGTTAERPSTISSPTHDGFCYFDITLGKPIWWFSEGWVDATGTTI